MDVDELPEPYHTMPKRWILVTLALALIAVWTNVSAARVMLHGESLEMRQAILAASADAYIAYNDVSRAFEIGNSKIRRQMRYDSVSGFRLIGLTNVETGHAWLAPGGSSAELRMVLDGEVITGPDARFALQDYQAVAHPDGSVELEVSLARGPLTARLHYCIFPWSGVFEQWISLENTGATVLRNLTALDSLSLVLHPSPAPLTLYWVQGLSPAIDDPEAPQPNPVLRLRSLQLDEGVAQELGSTERSSQGSMGWFALADPELDEGVFGGIEWSGAWQLSAARDSGDTLLRGGMLNIRHDLVPGQVFESPRRFLGFYTGDLDDAANASHAFARTYLMHPLPFAFPWTQYNTWYAYGISLDEGSLRRQVDAAAELGIELFYVDAGWYEGSPPEGDFGYGLGTWRENQEKFPSGLKSFADYVHSKGMRFGLWVEPERVDLRYVGDGKEIQWEWLAPEAREAGQVQTLLPSGEELAQTAQVCLGNPEAREWVKTWLARLVRDYDLEWLKWDNNLWMSCDLPGQAGDGNYAHVQGLYEVLDYLREQFPDLIVENCASGGNRMDYALMRRTDIAWLSDETDPSYRVRYHLAGASYAFPPEYLNTWLVDSPTESLGEGADAADFRAWLRSRMMGAFGISTPIADWPPEMRTTAAIEIAQYKIIRPIIANGQLYRLLPQTDLAYPVLEPPSSPDAAEFLNPGENRGVVFLFHGQIPWQQRRLTLKGLDPETLYEITSADRTISMIRTGEQLMTVGIRFHYEANQPSSLLLINQAPSGALPDPSPTAER